MDVEIILDKLEEFGYVRQHKRAGNYMRVYCPFHNDGNERRPSCGVLLVEEFRNGVRYPEGWWHCFTCGFAGTMLEAVSEILKIESVTQTSSQWIAENIPGYVEEKEFDRLIPENIVDVLENKLAISHIQSLLNEKPKYVPEEELQSYRYTVPYMYERKLTDDVIEKFDVGVDLHWIPPGRVREVPCITFPVRDECGNTLFICRRSIEGKLFNYPQGVTKPVYGIDVVPKGCKSVIICESCFNALTCYVYGYIAVALLGTGNAYQISQLRRLGVEEFVICMDGDDAGKRASSKLKRQLQDVAIIWTVPMPADKDVNDCTKEEFDHYYSLRE